MLNSAKCTEVEAMLFPGRDLITLTQDGFSFQADKQSAQALMQLQTQAEREHLTLRVCSAYRSVARQYEIFSAKYHGLRPVLDKDERSLNLKGMSAQEKIQAITYFSALPGLSRHHLGTDFDVYALNLLPPGQRLELTCREYAPGSYFYPLGQFLKAHSASCGFIQPFCSPSWKGGREPWHLSYQARADALLKGFKLETLLEFYQLFDDELVAPLVAYARTHYRDLLCIS